MKDDKQAIWTTASVEEEMKRRELLSASDDHKGMNVGGNHPASNTAINGLTKGPIDFLDPRAEGMCLVDIARGIALESRFFRQTRTHLSVAEHSVFVLDIYDVLFPGGTLDERRFVLMHDGHEAYLGDIGSPLKRAIERLAGKPVLVELEANLENQVLRRFGIPMPSVEVRAQCKRADLRARFCEGVRQCPEEDGWRTPDCEPPEGVNCEFGLSWQDAEALFLATCHGLGIKEVQL